MSERKYGRNVYFTRPNREPGNKLGWGVYSGGVTVNKVTEVLHTNYQIETGSFRTAKDAARSKANNIKGMPQLQHANTQMMAIAIYVLYERLAFDNTNVPALEDINDVIDQNMDTFLIKTNPSEDKKRDNAQIIRLSLKDGIVRYVMAIINHVTNEEDEFQEVGEED